MVSRDRSKDLEKLLDPAGPAIELGKPQCRVAAEAVGFECSCFDAVTRVYTRLKGMGEGDAAAFRSAVRTYRARHPEDSAQQAHDQVALWIDEIAV